MRLESVPAQWKRCLVDTNYWRSGWLHETQQSAFQPPQHVRQTRRTRNTEKNAMQIKSKTTPPETRKHNQIFLLFSQFSPFSRFCFFRLWLRGNIPRHNPNVCLYFVFAAFEFSSVRARAHRRTSHTKGLHSWRAAVGGVFWGLMNWFEWMVNSSENGWLMGKFMVDQ